MERFNKPRVFLSHSKQDKDFIEKLYNDLRKCQIEPWLDTEEIRHGRPWLDAIFQDGIPTCDCVLLYFTENSIESKMVKKEMDAGILHQLHDGGVAFLPYVVNAPVRNMLRADIQSLQVPVWSQENYRELLPSVVSEIWRSYLERTITTAVQGEKVKRLEAELQLKQMQTNQHSIFSEAEEADFRYIWASFDKECFVNINEDINRKVDGKDAEYIFIGTHTRCINQQYVVSNLIEISKNRYYNLAVSEHLCELLRSHLLEHDVFTENSRRLSDDVVDIQSELLMFGLIESQHIPPSGSDSRKISWLGGNHFYPYTPKMQRFRYWLAYNKLTPLEPVFTIINSEPGECQQ